MLMCSLPCRILIYCAPSQLLQYRKHLREEGLLSTTPVLHGAASTTTQRPVARSASATSAARLASGASRFENLARSLSESVIQLSSTPDPPTEETNTPAEDLDAADRRAVEEELKRWDESGVITDGHPEGVDFDLLRYWQVSLRCLQHSARL